MDIERDDDIILCLLLQQTNLLLLLDQQTCSNPPRSVWSKQYLRTDNYLNYYLPMCILFLNIFLHISFSKSTS